jgi:hypothetical protein
MPSNSSYIDANNMNPKQLATKLKELLENEEAYNQYFEFKKAPISENFLNVALMSYVSISFLFFIHVDYYTDIFTNDIKKHIESSQCFMPSL